MREIFLADNATGFIGIKPDPYNRISQEDGFAFKDRCTIELRWDLAGPVFIKAQYRWIWTQLKVTDRTELFNGVGIAIGFTFKSRP